MRGNNFILLLLSMVLVTSSCNYSKNVLLLSRGELLRDDFLTSIPFHYEKGLILVEATIGAEKLPRRFIFDTGAFESKVEKSWGLSLGLPQKATKLNHAAQGVSRKITITQMDTIFVGGVPFGKISAGLLQYDSLSASRCLAPGGLIGANLIQHAHWKIDYQQQQLWVSDRFFKVSDDAAVLPFSHPILSGKPSIFLNVGGNTVKNLIMDTGYNGSLTLPKALLTEFKGYPVDTLIDQSGTGIYGHAAEADTILRMLLPLRFGKHTLQAPVEFTRNGGYLGNEVLENFIVYLNYDNNTIAFVPATAPTTQANPDFVPGILSDSLWQVRRCLINSPVHFGDTLARIDSYRPCDLYDDYCGYVLGIRELLARDTLRLEYPDGEIIELYP
jgi:hypothetical protein